MRKSDEEKFDREHLRGFLEHAITKMSTVKDLEPLNELLILPNPAHIKSNINYTNSDHDEVLYVT